MRNWSILHIQSRDWPAEQKTLHTITLFFKFCFVLFFISRLKDGRGRNGDFNKINERLMLLGYNHKELINLFFIDYLEHVSDIHQKQIIDSKVPLQGHSESNSQISRTL